MRVMNRLHARIAGIARVSTSFAAEPEPRTIGSYACGRDLVRGDLLLGGHRLRIAAGMPLFGAEARPSEFEAAAQSFCWLGDLAALGDSGAKATADRWLGEWLHLHATGRGPGWTPALTGRRLLAWIDNAVFLMAGADGARQAGFLRAIARQLLFLGRRWQTAPPGRPRIEALTGLVVAARALAGQGQLVEPAGRALAREAGALVDPEGGIPSRNPEELLEIFGLLTRAASAMSALDQPAAAGHRAAIARIAPVLRALRHSDGGLARFHGGGAGGEGVLDRALALAGARVPATGGLAMGFLRVLHGRSSLILDAAAPPVGPASRDAHASTLAFELTSGRRPLVVSCGPGRRLGPDWHRAGRATASHSTLEMTGYSSSRFGRLKDGAPDGLLHEVPGDVRIQRTPDSAATEILGGHDGYVASHGLTHMRRLSLSVDGRVLLGEDSLAAVKAGHGRILEEARLRAGAEGPGFAIRFHLHPDVEALAEGAGGGINLRLLSGETWQFRHDGGAELALEPSVYLDPLRPEPRPAWQMVLSGSVTGESSRIRWSLAKSRDVPQAVRDTLRPDAPWLEPG